MHLQTLFSKYARQFGTLAGLVGLCVVLWILTPHFLTVSNLLNVAQQTSINAIIAVGLTFVIISGGIDLSVGSLVAFSGVVMASLMQRERAVAAGPGRRACDWPGLRARQRRADHVGASCRRSSRRWA